MVLVKSKALALLAIIAIAFFSLRLFLVTADPPAGFSFSNDLFTDEGPKTDYPRMVFFGDDGIVASSILCDGCPRTVYSFNNPLMNGFYLLAFGLFGPGFFSIRAVAIIFSLASVALLFLLVKSIFGTRPALIAAVLLACNFAFFTFNRVSFFENFALFFIVASLYAMHAAFRRASGACALASLALFSLAVLCKINALFALPAIALLFAYFTFESVPRGGRLRFAFFSAGFFIALNILLSLLNGNLALHGSLVSMRMPDSLFVLARDLLIAPANQIFAYAPLFSLIGFASALLLAFESLREKQGEEKFFRQAFAVLLFFGFFAFAFFAYQPPRYFYMLFPALAVFSGIALDRLFSKKPLPAVKRPFSLAEKAMLLFSALFVPYALSANAVKYLVGMENVSVSVAAYCACFAAIFIACLAIARLIGRRATGIGGLGAAGAGIAMFALAAIILVQAGHYASWAASPQYTMLESSLAFGEFAGQFEQPVAVGDWCFALAVETNVVCYRTYYGDVMPEQRFRDIGAQMLLSEDSEWAQNKEIYLSYKSLEFVFVREFDMGKSRIGLYRIVQNGGE